MNAGSLFTGIGGLDLGVGVPPAWFCEYDKHCRTVLGRHWPGVPIYPDVRELGADAPRVDVLHGGYPCQPFSVAGKREGENDPRHLWPEFARLIRVLRPRVVVAENVAGHLRLGFHAVLADLAGLGMDVRWGVVRASDVGAPHQRARLFVVAWDSELSRADALAALRGSRHPVGESGGAATDSHDGRRKQHDEGVRGLPVAREDSTQPTADTERERRAEGWSEPSGRQGSAVPVGHQEPASYADGEGREGIWEQPGAPSQGTPADGNRTQTESQWGVYAAAIQRWEHVLGRPAPRPTDDRGRLMPEFVEWMMGFPAGWTDGPSRTHRLRMLGNAVVPQQAALALSLLSQGGPTWG